MVLCNSFHTLPYLYSVERNKNKYLPTMNTTTQTPAARQEAYICQIEGTRDAVENFGRSESGAAFDATETARKLHQLRSYALYADVTELQEMKMHKDIARLVRHAERLQAEVERFEQAMKIASERIELKYLQNNYK